MEGAFFYFFALLTRNPKQILHRQTQNLHLFWKTSIKIFKLETVNPVFIEF